MKLFKFQIVPNHHQFLKHQKFQNNRHITYANLSNKEIVKEKIFQETPELNGISKLIYGQDPPTSMPWFKIHGVD